jgi:RNA polymerase sigma-70 factor (ECF subfamily)
LSQLDKIQFKEIFDQYFNALSNFAYTYVKDTKAAEDIVQDVFVKFWMKRKGIDLDGNVKSFLFQSTKNRAIEIIRRNTRNEGMVAAKTHEAQNQITNPEEVDKSMLKEKIFASIRQLPPKCQQIFKMSKLSGLTYREIADELDISVKTVENQIGRALKILRENLKN